MNKKISRLMGPGSQFFFFVLICFAVVAASFDLVIGVIEGVIIAVLAVYAHRNAVSRKANILKYIESVTSNVDSATKDTMLNAPLPMVIFHPETGGIVWCNEGFQEISGRSEQLFDSRIGDVVPRFSARWLLECRHEAPELMEMRGRLYRVYGNLTQQAGGDGREQGLLATMYWIDVTDSEEIARKYRASRLNVAIIMMDNYEELTKGTTDVARSAMRARIDRKINDWTASCHGLLRKYERDRYLFVFEEQYYEKLAAEQFSLLNSVHEVVSTEGVPATLSIGVGRGGRYAGGAVPQRYAFHRHGSVPRRRPGGGAHRYEFRIFRRPCQRDGETHQGQIPRDGHGAGRADERRRAGVCHGSPVCRYGRPGRCGGHLLHCPQERQESQYRHGH